MEDAIALSARIVAQVPGRIGTNNTLSDTLAATAVAATGPLSAETKLAMSDAAFIYQKVTEPEQQGWVNLDLSRLERTISCALARRDDDPIWHDYLAVLTAYEAARPKPRLLRALLHRPAAQIAFEAVDRLTAANIPLRSWRGQDLPL
ncbi:MAG: hypothetical protein ACRDTS_21200 [Mycobacterium sp.]